MYILFKYHRRLKAVFLFFFLFLIFCVIRLFSIQLFRSDYLKSIARKQRNLFVELEARRGTIYDSKLRPQAVNLAIESLYVSPRDVPQEEKEKIIDSLSPLLQLSPQALRERLSRDKSFVWIERKIDPQTAEQIKKIAPKGFGFIKESKRCYPNAYLGCHFLGFAGLDNQGLEGIEFFYDKYLKGQSGWAMFLRDARQKKLDLSEQMVPPVDGYDIVLTIDEVIQFIAERELDNVFNKYHAKAASIVVADPRTGAILAMANRPAFDLNNYASADKEKIRNRSICDLFEPGSVFKIVTASAALNEGKISEDDKIFCEEGAYNAGRHVLHDHRPHGWLKFREVIEKSSNIGTVKVAQILGAEELYDYIRLFGFGERLGIDLSGEITGSIKTPAAWSKTSILAIPMGQEVGVTALQLSAAISAVANGGELMRPYIVDKIIDKYGQVIKQFSPEVKRRVITPQTSERVKKILEGVVEKGTGKLAKMSGFSAAGKTGTAQKIESNGGYSHSKFIASFIGFAPVEEPLISIVVSVDEPRPYYYGGVVAAPVFKNVAESVLRYLKTNLYQDSPVVSGQYN